MSEKEKSVNTESAAMNVIYSNHEVKVVCRQLINEHKELAHFKAGFGKTQKCNCTGCEIARKILDE